MKSRPSVERGTSRWLLYVATFFVVAFLLYRPILSVLSPPPPGDVVRLWHSQRGAEREVLEGLLREFNGEHSGEIRVEPLAVPESSLKDKLLRNVPRGSGPDLFITSHNEIGELVRGRVVGDALASNGASVALADGPLLPGLLEGVTLGGSIRALPLTFKGLVQFFNRDLGGPIADTRDLETARLALPEGAFPIAWDASSLFFHAPLFLGEGGRVLDEAGEPALFEAAGRRTFALPGQWKKSGILPPEPTYNEAVRLFEEGKLRSLVNGPWYTPGGSIGKKGTWGIAPLPAVEGKPAGSFITVDAVFVASSSRSKWAVPVARYLASDRAQLERLERLGQAPTLSKRHVWLSDLPNGERPELSARKDMVNAQAAALRNGLVTPNVPRMAALWNPALDVLSASIAGRDVDKAIESAKWDLDRSRPSTDAPADSRPFGIALVLFLLVGSILIVRGVRRGLGESAIVRAGLIGRGGWRALPFLLPGLVAVVSLVVLPMLVGAAISFYSYEGDTFTFVGLRNFASILLPPLDRAFEARSFYFALAVTVLWTVLNVILHVAIGVGLALLLRPTWNRLRTVYRVILVLPWAIPNYITALLWKGMFNAQVGAINALLAPFGFEGFSWFDRFSTAFTANVVTNVWLGFPFMMVTTLGALSQVPAELEEAATLDGAGRWLRFRFVVWPHVAPALLPAVVLGSVWTFNMFNVVYLVSGGEPGSQTDILISEAYRWAFERGQRYGHAAAYSVLIFFFLLLFSRLGERAVPKGASS